MRWAAKSRAECGQVVMWPLPRTAVGAGQGQLQPGAAAGDKAAGPQAALGMFHS